MRLILLGGPGAEIDVADAMIRERIYAALPHGMVHGLVLSDSDNS